MAIRVHDISRTGGSRTPSFPILLYDSVGPLNIFDFRRVISTSGTQVYSVEDLPDKISGSYKCDYDITYIDNIIRRKLKQEKLTRLDELKREHEKLRISSMAHQTVISRKKTLTLMEGLKTEIRQIENGEKLQTYLEQVENILIEYRKCSKTAQTVQFGFNDDFCDLDSDSQHRIVIIEKFLMIASKYLEINIIRNNGKLIDICVGCSQPLTDLSPDGEGMIRCRHCDTENNTINMTKSGKDGLRVNMAHPFEDESIENFLKAFYRYQGLQDPPDPIIYQKLDAYFRQFGMPTGDEIKQLPLNKRGRRGMTDHKMLEVALSNIGHPEHYEDINLIGHLYWGWTQHNLMHHKETLIYIYQKTQCIFHSIPAEERGRESSLGTQYRLWRELQLVGHECYMDEFKIPDDTDSLNNHDHLWRRMCEGCNDPSIRFIA